ncbi:MAG: rhomboid family intramembrane serine protease [Flavobacteriales bacterium]|nr:rhomboid family intramembrane serine protease [Flavobacteriales bacterium]
MGPSLSLLIIVFTAGTSLLAFQNSTLFQNLRFNAWLVRHKGHLYRFFTSGLVHANALHLILNMYVLYLFGPYVESQFIQFENQVWKGRLVFAFLYLSALPLSTLYSFDKYKNQPHYNAVGASGAISAVVFAFIALRPEASMGLLWIPFLRLPAVVMGGLYLLYSWVMARRGHDNIGHDVHFFGALYGFLFIFIYQPGQWREFLEQLRWLESPSESFGF